MWVDQVVLVAGIDPAAVRPSAMCLMGSMNLVIKGDLNILLRVARGLGVQVIAIDSPLQLPSAAMRDVDRKARKMGLKVLPPGWKGMRKLVETVTNALSEVKVNVIETFPRAITPNFVWFREMDRDEVDACLCALAALAFLKKESYAIKGEEGSIVITDDLIKRKPLPRKPARNSSK